MRPLEGHRILVADDERNVRMLLRVVLENSGAEVVEAEDGRRALRLLELDDRGFDLLLTDFTMPNMDGGQLVEAVQMRWPDLPVVVCSALDLAWAAPALKARARAVVTKPFVPTDLVRTIALVTTPPTSPRAAAV